MARDLSAEMTRGLTKVPALSAVVGIADALRHESGHMPEDPLDLDAALTALNSELSLTDLGGGAGGPQGLLTPLDRGGFRIEVDPSLPIRGVIASDALRDEILRHRTRFIVAHELAHTLFYWQGRNGPERLVRDSAAQEQFCDALAAALLVPPSSAAALPLLPESVVSLHRSFDVSVEVAARALIATHHGGVAWLMVLPAGQEPWVQWGADESRETVRPWRLLSRLAERVKEMPAPRGRLHWRGGRTTVARGLYLADRRQFVVTASGPSSSAL